MNIDNLESSSNEWLIESYNELFNVLKLNTKEYISKETDQEFYTKHDESHCHNVEKMIKALVGKSNVILTHLEKFLLSCAAWTHDLGMNDELAKDYFKDKYPSSNSTKHLKDRRKEHHNISCWYLEQNPNKIFCSEQYEYIDEKEIKHHFYKIVRAISIIIQFHRKVERLDFCPEERSIKGEAIRLRLLAALLRLADTLHLDSSRYDSTNYRMVQIGSFDRVSRLHWLKSFFVTNVYLNEVNLSIVITLDLPDPYMFENYEALRNKFSDFLLKEKTEKEIANLKRGISNLEYIISSDVREELASVNKVFSKYGMPTYVNVIMETVYTRGYRKQEYDEMKEVLNELSITFSPNTSNVIKRAHLSLSALATETCKDDGEFERKFEQIFRHLDNIKKQRPCHVGLKKIVDLMEELRSQIRKHYAETNKQDEYKKRLNELVNYIKKRREIAFETIQGLHEKIVPESIKNIIVIGYSSTVMSVLEKVAKSNRFERSQINVFVLEAATKRRLMHSNLMEYNDSINYAREISNLDFFNIFIIPDAGLATLLNVKNHTCVNGCSTEQDIISTNTILLIGVNGIDIKNGSCAHSSGHLSAVLIAKSHKIPVIIVADSFKIGVIEWDLSATRDSEWLTTQWVFKDDLSSRNIALLNYREDEIGIHYITNIYTDIGIFDSAEALSHSGAFGKKYEELINKITKGEEALFIKKPSEMEK